MPTSPQLVLLKEKKVMILKLNFPSRVAFMVYEVLQTYPQIQPK